MENRILRIVMVAACALLSAAPAAAIVQIGESDGRFVLNASNETQRAVMDALAERFRFEVVYPDERWGQARRDYERSGTLDDLLKYVLSGTNFVASYWRASEAAQESVTRVEILGKLNPTYQVAAPAAVDEGPPDVMVDDAEPADYSDSAADEDYADDEDPYRGEGAEEYSDEEDPGDDGQHVPVPGEPQAVADMLRTRAQAASGMVPPPAPGIPPVGGDQDTQMRELTRRAHVDVKNLAEALRRAEDEMNANRSDD
jgi:hypothetical protein